ncbi:MAG: riboflavin biosynthesis protein RibF [Clostridia bacterium]|nr:riboflavin biosynthesis protein RibF [Clostridia bacterium]
MKNAIALGTFDGVHIGHKAVLNLPDDCFKIAVTFNLPPKAIFSGETELITDLEDKCRILKELGIDEVFVLDFLEVKDLSGSDFLEFLKEKFNPSFISCGYDYRFGKGGELSVKDLKAFCEKEGIIFRETSEVSKGGKKVSSSLIREMLKKGDFKGANRLLSEDFSFETEVISGDKRGRTIGFPTVNQIYPENLLKLEFGVYETRVSFDNKIYKGITNIGIRPTFKSNFIISETYIDDFSGDLYGKKLRITPIRFIRKEVKFSSIEELKKQIDLDLMNIKESKNGCKKEK